jgi:penicillin-binding protein 1C
VKPVKPARKALLGLSALAALVLAAATFVAVEPFPDSLPPGRDDSVEPRFVDRTGRRLSVTYQNSWNVHELVSLRDTPELLKQAFLTAEDQRFYEHRGVDWMARAHAVWQNLKVLRAVRGASTVTEQVVRMLHPRPRTLWSRWIEGFEAGALERRFAKDEILEFYLNQVPYARNRRGVQQAAREYFDRDLDTLSAKEMLALAVLVRSPSRLDLVRDATEIEGPIRRLAHRLAEDAFISKADRERIGVESLHVVPSTLDVDAAHFLRSIQERTTAAVVATTLDRSLQEKAQKLLDRQIDALAGLGVGDGAVLIVNHETDEILAWVNGGGFEQEAGGQIDMVTTPRQPGSAMKPFVYALALEKGITAATILEDEPTLEAVGHGLHNFRNYSRHYYGPIRLREALGNSLNVPAIRAVQYSGRGALFELFRDLGIRSLTEHPDFYGDGLALGNGEITLFELVSAYSVLARGGIRRDLKWTRTSSTPARRERVLSAETSSIVGDILSDPEARALEFGRSSVLSLPIQTAVKTGTSNDYRDAWVVGFSHRYSVGVWMGNLDRRPMRGVTGSTGPALVLRALFAELHRNETSRPLYVSRKLRRASICRESGRLPGRECPRTAEWFHPGTVPKELCPLHAGTEASPPDRKLANEIRIMKPTPGLHLALDPRIPDELERFELRLAGLPEGARAEWWVDGERLEGGTALWQPKRGPHHCRARVSLPDGSTWTDAVSFRVN